MYGREEYRGKDASGMMPGFTRGVIPVSLRTLFPRASFVGCGDIRVVDASDRSGECGPGTIFAAMAGTKYDGRQYIRDAVSRGAAAILVDHPVVDAAVPQCIVPDVRKSYAELCAALCAFPANRLSLAGITGTNGKTTTSWLIRSILREAGKRTGLIGTIEYHTGTNSTAAGLTTPDSKLFARTLASMVLDRTTHAAVELSSHALEQRRTAGTRIDVGIVTNITQDHFDYHQNFAAYRDSKARLIDLLKPNGLLLLNADDPGSMSIRTSVVGSHTVETFGLDSPADLSATQIESSLHGSRFLMTLHGQSIEVRTPLPGRHNISNCLAAAGTALRFGVTLESIAEGIRRLTHVPGRMERIDCGQPFDLFVDFAHTDDALLRCLRFLRGQTVGRVICLFGAGGDRDRGKRPLLGRAASEADIAVVTSDNPRTEDPQQIIEEILKGFGSTARSPIVEPDRREAIRRAIRMARPGDCILIAGKGHEKEQIIGTERHPFDDCQVARDTLEKLLGTTTSHQQTVTV